MSTVNPNQIYLPFAGIKPLPPTSKASNPVTRRAPARIPARDRSDLNNRFGEDFSGGPSDGSKADKVAAPNIAEGASDKDEDNDLDDYL